MAPNPTSPSFPLQSLTLGIPIVRIMYGSGGDDLGSVCLPILVYHPTQAGGTTLLGWDLLLPMGCVNMRWTNCVL